MSQLLWAMPKKFIFHEWLSTQEDRHYYQPFLCISRLLCLLHYRFWLFLLANIVQKSVYPYTYTVAIM